MSLPEDPPSLTTGERDHAAPSANPASPAPASAADAPCGALRREAGEALLALCDVMTTLRSPEGCDWDRAQDLHTLRSYLLEETHEVLDVLDRLTPEGGGPASMEHRDELGDLLLQIVFQAELQREQGRFDMMDVCDAIRSKLIRRHPHLFGDTPRDQKPSWEALKRQERVARGDASVSALAGVPREIPALLRAYRVGEKAHRVGFDWPDPSGVLDKIDEELAEVREAMQGGDKTRVAEEIGDLLYAIVNLSRHFAIDPEAALRGTIRKFEERFAGVEERLRTRGQTPEELPLEELEAHWQAVKRELAGR